MKKVAILGTAPGWEDAPFNDDAWEIWGISRLYNWMPRWDRWFELHRLEEVCETWADGDKTAEAAQRKVYHEWLGQQTKPVYLQEERPDLVPSGIRYPLGEVQRFLQGITGEDEPERYFTNTISYLIALAMLEGATEIGVYGVDMALDSEFGTQRPSCEYMIGLARGRGIRTIIPDRSDLLKTTELYGWGNADGLRQKLRYKRIELQAKRRHIRGEVAKGEAAMNALEGALRLLAQQEKDKLIEGEQAKELSKTLQKDMQDVGGDVDKGRLMDAAVSGNLDMLDYIERNWLHGVS